MEPKDVFGVMASRRTTRNYLPKPVEMEKLLQIVQAGSLAPSSGNLQNWRFVIVTDIQKIRDMYHLTMDQEPLLSATAAIIVTGDEEHADALYGMRGKKLYTIQNCAAAIQNMLLAATALDVGTTWIGAFDEDKISDMFDIPQDKHRPQAVILLGYPAEDPEPKESKSMEHVVFFNKFGEKVMKPHLVFFDWATEWRQQAQKIKAHGQHVSRRIQEKKKEMDEKRERKRAEAASRPPEKSTFQQARERMQDVMKNMKKEEYR